MNALIVNYSGLGDGLIEAPFLMHMASAAPTMHWHHTAGALFADAEFVTAMAIPQYCGTVPSRWRKFAEADWADIVAFIVSARVDVVVNFRNLGPRFDRGYFAFKEHYRDLVDYWNFDFATRSPEPQNIRANICALLSNNRVMDRPGPSERLTSCLRRAPRAQAPRGIAINMHSGNALKLWPCSKWQQLCDELAAEGPLSVLAGIDDIERSRARHLVRHLEERFPGRATLVDAGNVVAALRVVAAASCVVSTDSWAVHAAAGLGVRAVALYIVTSPVTWGGDSRNITAVTSNHLARCENFNAAVGICINDRRPCRLVEQEGDGVAVDEVLSLVRSQLARQRISL